MGSTLLVAQNIFRVAIILTLCAGFSIVYFKLDNNRTLTDTFKKNDEIMNGISPVSDGNVESTDIIDLEEIKQRIWYNGSKEIIWVGGCPRSGTTLSRAMLDAHPDIRCGEETHIIPLILDLHAKLLTNGIMLTRIAEAKVTRDVVADALASYLLTVIWKHGKEALHYCNKDPMVLNYMDMVLAMFPNSLFVFMIRDGRAVCHSMITREVATSGFDFETYRGCLADWSELVERQYDTCLKVGTDRCRPLYYELLVLDPETEMRELLGVF